MANYCSAVRTNYFHVSDEGRFRKLMGQVYGCEDDVELWEEKDKDGQSVFGFGCYGGISGIPVATNEGEDEENSYDLFIDRLQECVAEDDAIIIFEAGNEKLKYVAGRALVITRSETKDIDITDLAVKEAARMLGNSDWKTRCDY